MDEKSRIQAATILQGIVKGYMNPVRHMSADDENYEKWMRLVERKIGRASCRERVSSPV